MKFICQKDTILKEVEYASSFTSQRNSLSISSNILLENYQNILTIKGTDNKMGFMTSFPVSTEVPGATTVTCDKFLQVLKSLPSMDIEFLEEDGKLKITPIKDSKSINFNIRTIPAENFPPLSSFDETQFFSLSQRDFFDMIDKTSFAVGTDESKFFLTGVYLDKKDDDVVMVATDSKRLSFIRKKFEQDIPDFKSAIIPVKFLQILSNIGIGEGLFSLMITDTQIFAQINGHLIYSSLITGTYPAYQRVIPESFKYECKVKVSDMLEALNRVSIFVENNSKKVFLELKEDGIMASGETSDVGDAKEIISCEYSGEDVNITFNNAFLVTSLKKIDSEYFKLCFNSATTAMEIVPDPEKDYIFIIMPMHG